MLTKDTGIIDAVQFSIYALRRIIKYAYQRYRHY